MSFKTRLHRMEKLGHLHGTARQRPATVERTASGEYFILSADARTPIGGEDDFQRWRAAGNPVWAVIEGLTPVGSELVRRVLSGERTQHIKKGSD